MSAFVTGFGLGFAVAAQVGPIWMLCFRSVLRSTFAVGVAIGAGAALVDGLFAALGAVGVAGFLERPVLRGAFGIVGVGVLGFLGVRTLWSAFRVRLGGEDDTEIATPRRAFVTSVVATLSNPLTIASWAAVYSAASAAGVARTGSGLAFMLAGVPIGSLTWFVLLSAVLSAGRSHVGPRLAATIDVCSGVALLAFAGLLGWKAARAD